MAYGPHGTEFPDEDPRTSQPRPAGPYPQEQQGSADPAGYGDSPTTPQRRAARRPQPYDPFQTRARDEAAQQRPASDPYWGQGDQGSSGRAYGQAGYGEESGRSGRSAAPRYGSDQYGSDQY